MCDEEFWHLTLAQLGSLAQRYKNDQRRGDYRAALVCSVIAEVYRDRKHRSKPFTPDDFMPREEPEKMSNPHVKRSLELISKMLGGNEWTSSP